MLSGTVKSWPRLLLRVEGACIFASTIWAYARSGQSWWAFAGGLLLPDLGMVGYLANTAAGAVFYNAVHTETPPILLLCSGFARGDTRLTAVALVRLAHIGMDRMLGYGLKYGSGFGHTHLGLIGKNGLAESTRVARTERGHSSGRCGAVDGCSHMASLRRFEPLFSLIVASSRHSTAAV